MTRSNRTVKKALASICFSLLFLSCLFSAYTPQSGTQFVIKWTVTTPINSKLEILEFSSDTIISSGTEIPLEFLYGNQRVCKVQYTTNESGNITFTCKSTALKTESGLSIPYTLRMNYGDDTNSLDVGLDPSIEYPFPEEDLFTITFPGGMRTESILVYAALYPPGESDPEPLPGIYKAIVTFGVRTP